MNKNEHERRTRVVFNNLEADLARAGIVTGSVGFSWILLPDFDRIVGCLLPAERELFDYACAKGRVGLAKQLWTVGQLRLGLPVSFDGLG